MTSDKAVGILGTGSAVPEKVLTNFDLEQMVETSDEWIKARTGILERRIAKPGEAASDLSVKAAELALSRAQVEPKEIDAVIVATFTQDTLCPSTACFVQHRLGMNSAFAFDLNAACTGFIYGLSTARAYIRTGLIKKALVIGVDMLSKVTDYEDRTTCVLFGDAAGAAVVGEVPDNQGIIAEYLDADGKYADLIIVPGGGSRLPASEETVKQRQHYVKMKGNEVFKVAVRIMADAVFEALRRCDKQPEDLSLVIPHQANVRIIEASARRLGLDMDRFYMNIDRYGNTSAASVPVALDEALSNGRIKKGDLIALVAFGGGFTWGATIIKW